MRHRRCRIVMENRAATGNYAKSHSAAPLHSCYLIKRRSDRKKPFEPSPFSLDTISRPISTSISLCYCSIRDGHCVFIVRTIFLFIFLFTDVRFFPGCSCVVYSSSYSPQGGTFMSPDHPKKYPPNIDCLLYTFTGHPDEIVELTFNQFNIRRTGEE